MVAEKTAKNLTTFWSPTIAQPANTFLGTLFTVQEVDCITLRIMEHKAVSFICMQ